MKVCVVGLWHLGTVTAACLASANNDVVGLDEDGDVVRQLQGGQPPIYEPGLEELVRRGIDKGCLRFTSDSPQAVGDAQVVWVSYDTPVDAEDRADVELVVGRIRRLFPHLAAGTLVLVSSQLPVGTTRRVELSYREAYPDSTVTFGYSPENLRLGSAIDAFTRPDRVVVGLRSEADRERVSLLLRPFSERIEWMSVESAEMAKHALNAFLATSVAFANELASLCELMGADAGEVERALKSDARIGPRAYLSPGSAFAGGTLARDIGFLTQLGAERGHPTHLLSGVRRSNDEHKGWTKNRLKTLLGDLRGRRVAVWGLTYKPGTDTLRRSASVDLCRWLAQEGAEVHAHDPAVRSLPEELAGEVVLDPTPGSALKNAVALVVSTEWPEYRAVTVDEVVVAMANPLVIDPRRFLAESCGRDPRIHYFAVGQATL